MTVEEVHGTCCDPAESREIEDLCDNLTKMEKSIKTFGAII